MEWLKHSGKYLLLHAALLIYASAGIFSKMAGENGLLSWKFILFYGAGMVLLMIYAVLWQQVLKRMPLSIAFANKAVVILWGMIFGVLIFHEQVRWNMLLGAVVIFVGIILVSRDDSGSEVDSVIKDAPVGGAGLVSGKERDADE